MTLVLREGMRTNDNACVLNKFLVILCGNRSIHEESCSENLSTLYVADARCLNREYNRSNITSTLNSRREYGFQTKKQA